MSAYAFAPAGDGYEFKVPVGQSPKGCGPLVAAWVVAILLALITSRTPLWGFCLLGAVAFSIFHAVRRPKAKPADARRSFRVSPAGIELPDGQLIAARRINEIEVRNKLDNRKYKVVDSQPFGGVVQSPNLAAGAAGLSVAAGEAIRNKRAQSAFTVIVQHGGTETVVIDRLTEQTDIMLTGPDSFTLRNDMGANDYRWCAAPGTPPPWSSEPAR